MTEKIMDNITEQKERQIIPEIVKPGIRFQLFKPERIVPYSGPGPTGIGFESTITLRMEGLPDLEFVISAPQLQFDELPVSFIFLGPKEKEYKGYTITEEDLDPKLRWEKHKKAISEDSNEPLDQYLALSISAPLNKELKQEQINVLKRLRLRLISDIKAEGKPNEDLTTEDPFEDSLRLDYFYPLELGPLPKGKEGVPEGQRICIPNDKEKIQTIQGIFVIASEAEGGEK